MNRILLTDFLLQLNTDLRIDMIDANRVDKSTTVKLILNDLTANSGACKCNHFARIANIIN